MATYAIGDVQGCFEELVALYDDIEVNPDVDRVILVGDLVNRGPLSLPVLRWAYARRDHVHIVLGNHDLHFLAVHRGFAKQKRGDTLEPLLVAEDAEVLTDWLRAQPLVMSLDGHLFVHAGLMPAWTAEQALSLSNEVRTLLSGPAGDAFLSAMYGNQPAAWSDDLEGISRHRLVVNACTRMRLIDQEGEIDFKYKGETSGAPTHLLPWFDHPARLSRSIRVVCGHWSALGLLIRDDIVALDTGCVWGGSLTAVRLEDDRVYQVASRQARVTSWE
ncbi:symmetrical bis(5'-nucleosyl)-tetraphosphatase [Chitinimonas sp. BJYL2]|uniref:symmetrical bis(5'-nucleosyl)-tetraphosphatase n=1 Tax=Chitinimonas sp. BJYL2 TaxID=2976696 RepID=UPI0022B2C0C0|nr:symmetrical bis(5'-nucleosyl)-tetraphosphatase [Chitinimonas sp. BJYL2]